MEVPTATETTLQTLALLEERLRRIDYVLNGNVVLDSNANSPQPDGQLPATTRMRNLNRSLDHLATKHPAVAQTLDLQKRRPELFDQASETLSGPDLPRAALTQIVIAHEQTYRTLSAQLQQLQTLSVPDTESSIKLVKQRERIDKVRQRQLEQMEAAQELRTRSAKVLESWYENGVLGMGEMWAQWETRLRTCEIAIRRAEAAKQREEGKGAV